MRASVMAMIAPTIDVLGVMPILDMICMQMMADNTETTRLKPKVAGSKALACAFCSLMCFSPFLSNTCLLFSPAAQFRFLYISPHRWNNNGIKTQNTAMGFRHYGPETIKPLNCGKKVV
jgi:hypothetical protein